MLQDTVKRYLPVGNAGQIYKSDHSYNNTVEKVIVDAITGVGKFVQANGNVGEAIMASGQPITGEILGVVVKDELRNSNGDTDLVLKGSNQTVLNTGNIYIEDSGIITEGSYVFLTTAAGALAYGSSTVLSGSTYTGFRVDKGNAVAGRCLIGITTARA